MEIETLIQLMRETNLFQVRAELEDLLGTKSRATPGQRMGATEAYARRVGYGVLCEFYIAASKRPKK